MNHHAFTSKQTEAVSAATGKRTRNPFRSKFMRAAFDEMVLRYDQRASVLFLKTGERNMGNSAAGSFWRGFDGVNIGGGFTDRASKDTMMYAHWKAGAACKSVQP